MENMHYIKELIELFKRADIIISTESGTAHIAWACNKPSVIILCFATSTQKR